MTTAPTTALTIAGSDSGGGAGIQADLKTFAAYRVFGLTAVTAVTAQNSLGVQALHGVPADIVAAQIRAVASDFGVRAAKTGMLVDAATVEAVVACVDELRLANLVVDPVLAATSGERLLAADAVAAVRTELLRRARVVTPNRAEAELLTGRPIASLAAARDAARRLHDLGPEAVIVKGGHLREEPEPTPSTSCSTAATCSSCAARASGPATVTAPGARSAPRWPPGSRSGVRCPPPRGRRSATWSRRCGMPCRSAAARARSTISGGNLNVDRTAP